MYKLLGFPTQNNNKVLYVLAELGVKYEVQYIDLLKGEQRQEPFNRLSPIGKVPVLQHNDEFLFESGAICRYLANVEKSALYPQNELQRARVDQWMDYFTCHLGRWLNTYFYESFIKSQVGQGVADPATCKEALGFIHDQSVKVDKWLEQNKFLANNQLSIADLCAFAYVEQAIPCKISLDAYPNLKRWYEMMDKKENLKQALQVWKR